MRSNDRRRGTRELRRFQKGPLRRALAAVAALALILAVSGAGSISTVWGQETIALPPVAPALDAPADGAMLEDTWGTILLQWDAVPGASEYQVILNGGERTGPWVTETSWSPGSLPAGTYQWTVRARNEAGMSEAGSAYTFIVAAPGEGAPVATEEDDDLEPLPFQLEQPAIEGEGSAGAAGEVGNRLGYQMPVELPQQDATDATAGSAGASGTVNGEPREPADSAPVDVVGPGNPGNVLLPPSVPGVPANANPAVAPGIGGTTELVFDAISDTTVFTAAPGSPQTPESVNYLAIGGPNGAVALVSFEISGVGEGTVLGARLTFYGAGETGAPGGSVGVIYDFIAPDGLTANGTPSSQTALNVHGAPSWFERVEPNGLTAADVTGSVYGDGTLTFVLPGQPEATGSIYSLESGSPPQLILTVGLPG